MVDSFAYTYDRAGQRNLETTPEATRRFGYDQYRQLTSAATAASNAGLNLDLTYSFDPIGNRLATSSTSGLETQNPKRETYVANSVNQYTRIDTATSTSTPITSTSAPSYDDNGNTTATEGLTLTWDDENRLASSTNGLDTTFYRYDGLGRRVEKSEYRSGSLVATSRFVYDGWRVAEELTSTSTSDFNLARSYTRGLDLSGSFEGAGGIGSLLALTAPVTADGQPSTALQSASYVYDGNGNVTALVADDGAVRASYRYDPFGQRLAATGAWADVNPYQFSSKERDAGTGFYYYGLRYYNPSTGRWLSRDPIEEEGGANLYVVVGNSPLNDVDPLGEAGYIDLIRRLMPKSVTTWYSDARLAVVPLPPVGTLEVVAFFNGEVHQCVKRDGSQGFMFIGEVGIEVSAGIGTSIGGNSGVNPDRKDRSRVPDQSMRYRDSRGAAPRPTIFDSGNTTQTTTRSKQAINSSSGCERCEDGGDLYASVGVSGFASVGARWIGSIGASFDYQIGRCSLGGGCQLTWRDPPTGSVTRGLGTGARLQVYGRGVGQLKISTDN